MPNDFETDLTSGEQSGGGTPPAYSRLRFGVFDLDTENYELRRRGLRVKLQQKPFQILKLLIAQAGKFVSRAQLARHLWPDLHVNFDRSLNTAVNSLRRALGDSPDNPRFIETRSGLGYRFIAPIESIEESAPQPHSRDVPARNQDAYHDYLKGRYLQNKMTEEDLSKSVAYFEAALKSDPDCALAHAGLADTCGLFAYLGVLPAAEAHRRARHSALSALRIDGGLAEAHAALASVKKLDDWDFSGSEREYKKALALKPNYADGHRQFAALLSALGRHQEALQHIRLAQQLDPLSLVVNADAAWVLYMARDYQGAMEQAWRTLTMEPKFAPAQHSLGLAYQQMGMLEEATVEFQNACVCSADHPAAIAALGHVYATSGRQHEAEDLLRRLERSSEERHVSAYWIALLHAGLGDAGTAIHWLEKARDRKDVWLIWLSAEPRFDPLRGDSRLQDLAAGLRPAFKRVAV